MIAQIAIRQKFGDDYWLIVLECDANKLYDVLVVKDCHSHCLEDEIAHNI